MQAYDFDLRGGFSHLEQAVQSGASLAPSHKSLHNHPWENTPRAFASDPALFSPSPLFLAPPCVRLSPVRKCPLLTTNSRAVSL